MIIICIFGRFAYIFAVIAVGVAMCLIWVAGLSGILIYFINSIIGINFIFLALLIFWFLSFLYKIRWIILYKLLIIIILVLFKLFFSLITIYNHDLFFAIIVQLVVLTRFSRIIVFARLIMLLIACIRIRDLLILHVALGCRFFISHIIIDFLMLFYIFAIVIAAVVYFLFIMLL